MDFYRSEIELMTLQEALSGYYLKNPSFTAYYQLKSERAKRLVRAHDISHLVFGCATDPEPDDPGDSSEFGNPHFVDSPAP
jgi:hypothetical protein